MICIVTDGHLDVIDYETHELYPQFSARLSVTIVTQIMLLFFKIICKRSLWLILNDCHYTYGDLPQKTGQYLCILMDISCPWHFQKYVQIHHLYLFQLFMTTTVLAKIQAVFWRYCTSLLNHSNVIMSAVGSQINGVSIVCSNVCSGRDQRKHQSSASLCGEFTGDNDL